MHTCLNINVPNDRCYQLFDLTDPKSGGAVRTMETRDFRRKSSNFN